MKYLLLLILLTTNVLATKVEAREIWRDGEFSAWSGEFMNSRTELPFSLFRIALEMPANGAMVLVPEGSFEVYIPCKKAWVKDQGILIVIGCDANRVGDTISSGPVVLYDSDECQKIHKVALMVRLPRMYPTEECRPTDFRWVGGYYFEEK